MRRTFYDEDLLEWEAYVSGGEPGTESAARIYFLCLTAPSQRARYVVHDSGNPAEAERALSEKEEGELNEMLQRSQPLS